MALVAVGGDCSQLGLDGLGALFRPEWFWDSFHHRHLSPDSSFIFQLHARQPQEQVENMKERPDLEFDIDIPVPGT